MRIILKDSQIINTANIVKIECTMAYGGWCLQATLSNRTTEPLMVFGNSQEYQKYAEAALDDILDWIDTGEAIYTVDQQKIIDAVDTLDSDSQKVLDTIRKHTEQKGEATRSSIRNSINTSVISNEDLDNAIDLLQNRGVLSIEIMKTGKKLLILTEETHASS